MDCCSPVVAVVLSLGCYLPCCPHGTMRMPLGSDCPTRTRKPSRVETPLPPQPTIRPPYITTPPALPSLRGRISAPVCTLSPPQQSLKPRVAPPPQPSRI